MTGPADASKPPLPGTLDDDEKLDIALADSMLTSEPPQIAEPKTAADDLEEKEREAAAKATDA